MVFLVIFIVEFILLLFLSRALTRSLSRFLSIHALSFIFLPGIIIHELSHLLTAAILFVPVGEIEFMPKVVEGGVKLGSVAIGKTDPIRRAIIGFAPVLAGLTIIIGIIYLFTINLQFLREIQAYFLLGIVLLAGYILFAISNTMFSSSRDMEGTVELFITILIIFGISYFMGFRPSFSFIPAAFIDQISDLLQKSILFLAIPVSIDVVVLGVIKLLRRT